MTSTTTTRLWGALMGAMVVVILYGVWVVMNDDSDSTGHTDVITSDYDPQNCFNPTKGMSLEDFIAALGEPGSSQEIITATGSDPEVPATEYYWDAGTAIFIDGKADFWALVSDNIC